MLGMSMHDHYLQALGITRWVSRDSSKQDPANPWFDLENRVATCRACGLCEGRTQTVFGVGDRQAKLMIIGEAPGYHEDQQGEPFVGRAGQLLNKMLASINLSREEVFIANILKCRPPNNRDPLPDEIEKCTNFLDEQIAMIQPALLVAVGRFAAHYLLQSTQSLARLRGRIHHYKRTLTPLIVTYHPAYLLRNPSDKKNAYQDLLFIQKTLEETHEAQT